MELRRTIKAPKRFDEDAFENTPKAAAYRPPANSIIHPRIKSKPIEYNPDLPPAAFPTIDRQMPRKSDVKSCVPSKPRSPQRNSSQQFFGDPLRTTTQSSRSRTSHNRHPRQDVKMLDVPPPKDYSAIKSHPPITLKKSSQETDEIQGGRWSNGPNNPVYMSNMKVMEELGERTEEDWFMAEMETSDEEEPSTVAVKQVRKMNPGTILCPAWEDLTVAHQADMIDTLSGSHGTREAAADQLGLNSVQKRNGLELLRQRDDIDAMEEARIINLQNVVHGHLINGNQDGVKHMSQAKYRDLLDEHLYRPVEIDFHTSCSSELAKAKRYLESHGHDPKLLDRWNKASLGSQKGIGNFGNESEELTLPLHDVPDIRISKSTDMLPPASDVPKLSASQPTHSDGVFRPTARQPSQRSDSNMPSTASSMAPKPASMQRTEPMSAPADNGSHTDGFIVMNQAQANYIAVLGPVRSLPRDVKRAAFPAADNGPQQPSTTAASLKEGFQSQQLQAPISDLSGNFNPSSPSEDLHTAEEGPARKKRRQWSTPRRRTKGSRPRAILADTQGSQSAPAESASKMSCNE